MLPHITNSYAGVNRLDPVHKSLFEAYLTVPEALRAQFGADEAILSEHILSIGGLDSLDKGPDRGQQKFMGTSRSYLNPKLDDTSHELTIKFSLNLRNRTDNYVYKLLKAWNKLCYDISTGKTELKQDYVCDWLKISIGNRAGEIYRTIIYKDVMMVGGLTGHGDLDYTQNEAVEVEVKFASDWAEEIDL